MTILFYSTNASRFDGEDFDFRTFPRRSEVWKKILAQYPDHRFIVATSLPGFFLTDVEGNAMRVGEDRESLPGVREDAPGKTGPVPGVREDVPGVWDSSSEAGGRPLSLVEITGTTASEIAGQLISLQPDLAISATFWVPPYDWLGLQDALVAERLRAAGIKTFCHSTSSSLYCFDKNMTHNLLSSLGFRLPKAVYVHHELYWTERRHKDLKTNVYKDYVLSQIEKMHYPVVIKDTVGLSSYSMEVAVSYKQALMYLNSGRTTCDRLVEEFIDGQQFGCEIYGSKGSYTVLPPFAFSVNRYGITSPKQSVKLGPVTDPSYKIEELKNRLCQLAKVLDLSPCAQVDLIFKDGLWYLIEINPRLSGMSETYAASLGLSSIELLLKTALAPEGREGPLSSLVCAPAVNFKLPILSDEQIEKVRAFPGVAYVHQIHNKAAKQEREKGYCEVVLTAPDASPSPAFTPGQDSTPGPQSAPAAPERAISSLMQKLESFAASFSDIMEEVFLENARSLASSLF